MFYFNSSLIKTLFSIVSVSYTTRFFLNSNLQFSQTINDEGNDCDINEYFHHNLAYKVIFSLQIQLLLL